MTTTNLDAMRPSVQDNIENLKTMSLLQILRRKEDTEAEVESLCNLMYQLNKARLQYESAVEILIELNSTKNGMPAVLPLTSCMYVQGDICNINKIVLTLGNEYQMEVDKKTAINHFIGKIQRVRGKIGATQKILANKMLERERHVLCTPRECLHPSMKQSGGSVLFEIDTSSLSVHFRIAPVCEHDDSKTIIATGMKFELRKAAAEKYHEKNQKGKMELLPGPLTD